MCRRVCGTSVVVGGLTAALLRAEDGAEDSALVFSTTVPPLPTAGIAQAAQLWRLLACLLLADGVTEKVDSPSGARWSLCGGTTKPATVSKGPCGKEYNHAVVVAVDWCLYPVGAVGCVALLEQDCDRAVAEA